MSVYVEITKHRKLFLNEQGVEVYPPGHPNQGMVRPENERQRRKELPPKSLAEESMELEAARDALVDDEAKEAMEILKKKGLKVDISI